MAAPDRSYSGKGGRWTHTLNVAAAAGTMDLPAPGAALCWVIDSIWTYFVTAITALDINVTESGGAIIGRSGTSAVSATQPVGDNTPLLGPLICKRADQAKVVVTTTGATNMQITVNAHLEPAN